MMEIIKEIQSRLDTKKRLPESLILSLIETDVDGQYHTLIKEGPFDNYSFYLPSGDNFDFRRFT